MCYPSAHRLCVAMRKVQVQMSILRPDILSVAQCGSVTPENLGQHPTLSHECFLPFHFHLSFCFVLINMFVIL
jgi:hypothetical protein